MKLEQKELRALERLASKYIWWKPASESVTMPEQVAAQVMNLGDWEDICALVRVLGDDRLRDVVEHAEAGMFDARSWHYWHYRLGMAELGTVPPLPARFIPPEQDGPEEFQGPDMLI